jgi:hypothetical protein
VGGAPGGENREGFPWGDPAGLDPGEGFLAGVGLNIEIEAALGKFRPITFHGRFEPTTGRSVIVLGQDLAGAGEAGFFRGEVGAEEKKIAGSHGPRQAAQEGEGIEIWQNAEKGDEPRVAGFVNVKAAANLKSGG